MTEINFVEGGYWAAQWTYNIPPVGNPPAEFSYQYDSLASDLETDEFRFCLLYTSPSPRDRG